MQVVLIILSLGLLGVIIYYAVSSKSSRLLKLSALGALGLIVVSLGVASIIIALSGDDDAGEAYVPIFVDAPEKPPERTNTVEMVIFLVILAAMMCLIAVIASRDRKKRLEEEKKRGSSPLFKLDGKPDDLETKAEEPSPPKSKDDDPFNLDLG